MLRPTFRSGGWLEIHWMFTLQFVIEYKMSENGA